MHLIQAPMQALIVDRGRQGHAHKGYCQSGALDSTSLRLANIICGNPQWQAGLEILNGHCQFEATQAMRIVVTGARLSVLVNGENKPRYRSITLQAGDIISFSPVREGLRSYVAFSQCLAVPTYLGSQCTVTKEGTGGLLNDGVSLRSGQTLVFEPPSHIDDSRFAYSDSDATYALLLKQSEKANKALNQPNVQHMLACLKTKIMTDNTLRMVFAYQAQEIGALACNMFTQKQYRVTTEIDRMGMRLMSSPLKHMKNKSSLYSEGLSAGAIQIPPNGQPIVMLNDRQTIGGYPKIGSVISSDLPILAQVQPNSVLEFIATDLYSARQAFLLHERLFTQLINALDAKES